MRLNTTLLIAALLMAGASPALAQQTPPAPPPAEKPEPVPIMRPPMMGRSVNLQIEFTIADRSHGGTPTSQVISMLVADGAWGRIRAAGSTRATEKEGSTHAQINVDARPVLLDDGAIRLEFTLEYQPLKAAENDRQNHTTKLNESLVVILRDGRAMTVSQAVDPLADRRIAVEVKATMVK